ncbi:MAG: FAD-binding oxidoreductase [archaeon]
MVEKTTTTKSKSISKPVFSPYEIDASQIKGKATNVIFPKTISDVKAAVALNKNIAIRGGGTGLVGGAVPQEDVVLDMSKMDKITGLDTERRTVDVEAGVILDELQAYLMPYGLEFPVNPSSHSVCTIGGMIATNAVGSRAIKYGDTSRWVNWIEIVDADGALSKKGATELSDYVGMEGTTGLIVRACIKLVPRRNRTARIVPCNSIEQVAELTRELKREKNISMIEFLDRQISSWLDLDNKYHLIVEFESDEGELKGSEYEELMDKRDRVYPILSQKGYVRIEDPQMMLDRFERMMPWFEHNQIPVFAHVSVGILHPCFSKEQEKLIPEMMKIVKKLGGKISGEHGIGLLKKEFIEPNDRKILINIKKRCDTQNKFNMGKVV